MNNSAQLHTSSPDIINSYTQCHAPMYLFNLKEMYQKLQPTDAIHLEVNC